MKAALPEQFSLMVFGWSQVAMDIQPLIAMATGEGVWHGVTHTLLGATVLGLLSAFSGKYLVEWGIRLISLGRRRIKIGWGAAILSGLIGGYSHILLDGLLHDDMQPFWPLMRGNPLLAFGVTFGQVEKFCLVCGLLGILWLAAAKIQKIRKSRNHVPSE